MSAVLGISAYYHDSAAALLVDGKLVAAAQEERFTRQKHDSGFPTLAANYCMERSGLGYGDLDYVAFYEKPYRKFERLLETYLATAPRGWPAFAAAIPTWLRQKLHLSRDIHRHLQRQFKGRIIFPSHHESHAASAFFASPFEHAAILTADGVGEWETTTLGTGQQNRIELFKSLEFPHSLGLLYSAFTSFCGFSINSGEAKLMGLAPFGQPNYVEDIRQNLIDVKPDGSFRLDLGYFNFHKGLTMTSGRFHRLFGGPPRKPETEITQREMDLASSIQVTIEDILLKMAHHLHQETGLENLCIAGGLGLNCVANGLLRREGPFNQIWVQPAAGDSGGSIGAAMFAWYQLLGNMRNQKQAKLCAMPVYTGPEYEPSHIQSTIQNAGLPDESVSIESFTSESDDSLLERVSELLIHKKVIGWFHGRMEMGPRALGNRSILADPRCPEMQDHINRDIKFRESFRPFAPVALASQAHHFFEVPQDYESPFMLFTEIVKPNTRHSTGNPLANLPSITHVNQSARLQTVTAEQNAPLAKLLEVFASKTGCPVLLNTSLNVRGQPIACSPVDAIKIFKTTQLDALVLGNILLRKIYPDDKNASEHP